MKKLIIPILALSILSRFFGFSFFGDSANVREQKEIIQEMVQCYAETNEAENIVPFLDELGQLDYDAGVRWTEIMKYWDYANHDMMIQTADTPKDLPDDNSLCFVVLGYQLGYTGTIQPELLGRLETALNCAVQYPNSYILCTGGGTAMLNKSVTEAGQMVQWLREHGIPDARIIIEDRSTTTQENAIFSYGIIEKDYPQIHDLVIVSSDYHIPWGAVLFQTVGILNAPEGDTPVIQVVDNAAFETDLYGVSVYGPQAAGILSIAGIS